MDEVQIIQEQVDAFNARDLEALSRASTIRMSCWRTERAT